MNRTDSNNEFNLKGTINFIIKYKLILIITFFVTTITIGLLSTFLPNYYKAQVALMPADSNAVSKAVLSQMDNFDALAYGKENDAEYVLELLNSSTLIWKTAEKFNLAEHYGIKDIGQAKSDKLNQRIVSNIKFKRTENLGVKITVWDQDPKYAADIANFMAHEVQNIRNEIKKVKMDSLASSLKISRDRMKFEIAEIKDSLSFLSKQSKIFNPDMMSDRLSQELAKQIASGNNAAVVRLENKLSVLGEQGSQIVVLRDRLKNKIESLRIWEEKLEQVRVDAESNAPTDFIIDIAYPADLKDKPKRSIIAIIGGISCTFLAIFVLILRDRTKAVKAQNEIN